MIVIGGGPLSHFRFEGDVQSVRDAVDIVEVGNHLSRVVNRAIAQSHGAQTPYVLLVHCRRCT